MADQNPSEKDNFCVNEVDVGLTAKVTQTNKGMSAPSLFTTFEATCFPQEYIKLFYEAGFKEPTLIQARSWPIAMQGNDIIAIAKTGSGRKLGFLIPCFIGLKRIPNDPKRGPKVLVLCPTDDLATEILSETVKFGTPTGIKTICLHGAVEKVPQMDLEEGAEIVVASLATLRQLIDILEYGKLSLHQLAYLVLYESDHLLISSVEPQLREILAHLPSKHCQTLVFTTTWPKDAKDIVSKLLHDPVFVTDGSTIGDPVDESSTYEGLCGTSNELVLRELMPPAGKKLLVLTVKGILADIVMLNYCSNQANFKLGSRSVFLRPFYVEFLKFCFANFEVGIWSSSNMYNLEKVVNYLFGDLKDKLLFCWDQSKSTATNLKTKDNSNRPVLLKELKKLWEKEEPNLPWQKGRFREANTLLVDNSPYKALCNPPFTAIFPNSYNFNNKEDNSLGVDGDLRLYLEKVATAEDVRCYIKDNPFGQPAITESHPEWNHYLPALRS